METKDFGWALIAMRDGNKVARSGWNGHGMWVVLQKAYPEGIPINKNTAEATGIPEGTVCQFAPYFMMNTSVKDSAIGRDGTMYTPSPRFVPWLASNTDLLGLDWYIVE